jgi:pimeloyl-ACP methyl ester carboxylesterase
MKHRAPSPWFAFALAALLLTVVPACSDDDPFVPSACRSLCLQDCSCVQVVSSVVDLPSTAMPVDTPGSPGVTVAPESKLAVQFGGTAVNLNHATYTRFRIGAASETADAIVILVPGFEGGAGGFKILAEQLLPRALQEHDLLVELWAYDRRTNQLEDREGLLLAASSGDPHLALDWLFGEELELPLSPRLQRRGVIYNTTDDVPFIANWTPLVFSRDIDAVVEAAHTQVKNGNVFLGGHSAGTGFTARYAATEFDLSGDGPTQPGYAKLRGLVLLEGDGGNTQGDPPSEDTLDRIEARFDGGLFAAVRDGQARCVDGTTACTVETEDSDCGHLTNAKCTPPISAYAQVEGLLNPHVLAAVEVAAIQGQTDPDTGQVIVQIDQGSIPGNNAVEKVPGLAGLSFLPQGTVMGTVGSFVDDDGFVASIAAFVSMSVGFRGPVTDGVLTWLDITEEVPGPAFRDNGPAPTELPAGVWGVEREPTRFDRLLDLFIEEANFLDWYFPSSGLTVTEGLLGLDSSALSLDPPLGRGRRDIENLTQAANIDIPVIGLGGSNGLTTVPGRYVAFANSIGRCAAPSCDGATPRVVDASNPSEAFPTLGGIDGGFEVHISEGYSHVDIVTAEDGAHNRVIEPLGAFLARNAER